MVDRNTYLLLPISFMVSVMMGSSGALSPTHLASLTSRTKVLKLA